MLNGPGSLLLSALVLAGSPKILSLASSQGRQDGHRHPWHHGVRALLEKVGSLRERAKGRNPGGVLEEGTLVQGF